MTEVKQEVKQEVEPFGWWDFNWPNALVICMAILSAVMDLSILFPIVILIRWCSGILLAREAGKNRHNIQWAFFFGFVFPIISLVIYLLYIWVKGSDPL